MPGLVQPRAGYPRQSFVIALFGSLNQFNETMASELEASPVAVGRRFLAERAGWSASTPADAPSAALSGSARLRKGELYHGKIAPFLDVFCRLGRRHLASCYFLVLGCRATMRRTRF
jgi:hypothetical protein